MYKSGRYILFFLFSIVCLNVNAQSELKFERYTTDQGLVQNYVECIFQDDYGFMWFGTRKGISRFDGVNFKNYLCDDNDSCSLPTGWVQSIQAYDKNRLWIGIGSSGRLMSYDYKTDCFTRHKLHLSEDNENQYKVSSAILYDSKGLLWTILSGKFAVFNPKTKKTVLVPQNNKKMSGIYATFIYEDRNGFVWIGTYKEGLFKYNKRDSVFFSYKYDPENPNTISSNFIHCIYEDSKGNIWIGTDKGGLNRYVPPSSLPEKKEHAQGNFERFLHPDKINSLSHNTVYSICEDAENNLWVGTMNGLCLFDRDFKKFYTYYYDDRDPESLNDNIVRSLYCDKSGNLWAGTRLGVAKLKRNRFKTYKYSSYKNSLSHNKVDYLFADASQNIFICTPVGIDYFNINNKTFQPFKGVEKEGTCLSASPICMAGDLNGYWIGTYNGGLYYYDIETQKCDVYTHNEEDTFSLGNNSIYSIYIDSKNTIWIGTQGNGLNVFNKKTGKFNQIPNDYENYYNAVCIYEDKDKNIWVGTKVGLYLLNEKMKRLEYYSIDKQKDELYICCLYQNENRDLWVGTEKGLYQVNTKTGESKSYQIEDGLPSLRICSILEDNNHNTWISTKNGLARYTPQAKNKNKKSDFPVFKTYGKEDGAQSEFLERSSCKLSDGAIAFGGSEGLSIFHPDNIKEDTIKPQVMLISLRIFNKSVEMGEEINGQVVLNQSFITTNAININYQNNNFTIEFAGLHYRNSELNQYAYKLEGYDKEWNYTHAENRYATYTDLPYDTYNFLVKASNSDGIWSNNAKKLTIHVLPPWWLTLWFKIFIVVAVVSAVIIWFRLKTFRLRKQKKVLEKIVERRTTELKEMNVILREGKEELESQMEQMAKMNKEIESMAKQLHDADQSKLRFFANISHEFRTPLSLIISPLEKYLKIDSQQSANSVKVESSYLKLMHRNAKRLLRLINQVIDFRKMDQGEKKLRVSNNNIKDFLEEVIEAFSVQAEQKGITLLLEDLNDDIRKKLEDFWFDPDIMEKVIYNLISNAIKYTREEGSINVELIINNEQLKSKNTENEDQLLTIHSSLLIKISDTGIGIKKENLDKIYDRFYRVDNEESLVEEGTGIGLAYTKELVELHKGTISVESELGKGSTFILQFPIGKEHFEKSTIGDKSTNVKLDYIHSMIDMSEKEINASDAIEVEEEDSGDEQDSEKATILIVEDNTDLRKFLKEELETQYNVLEAKNGQEGWEIAFETDPGLIVSDIMMPVMDGVTLCKKIKADENTSHIPVILLTAKMGNENTIEGLETGANDYITKPFDVDILKIKIDNLFLLQKKLKEKFSQSIDVIPSEITHSSIDEEFIQKAVKVINDNMQDYEFENDTFVTLMSSSRSVVYRKIRNITGGSVSEFIRSIRLKAAAKLLLEGNTSIKNVSYQVGFKYPNTFTKHFTEMFGKSPRQFIKDNLKK